MIGNTVIKSPQKSSVIQQSPTYSSRNYKLGNIKTEIVENEENRAVNKCKEESDEQQYIPSTSGSGMQIITHIPHLVLNAHPGMMAFKFQTVTIARL